MLPADHPSRRALAEEVHARPPEPLETPGRATHIAVLIGAENRLQERMHVEALCHQFAVRPPDPQSTHFSAQLGAIRFKWERHGEFSGFTMLVSGSIARPFSDPVASELPAGWLTALPGRTLVAAQVELLPAPAEAPDAATLATFFGDNIVVGGQIGGGAGLAFTDFKVHADGLSRFVVFNRSLTAQQAGRTLQRLLEIEVYRMMALLALPIATQLAPRIAAMESSLSELTADIGLEGGKDESLLQELTRLAAEIESCLSISQFRFGACRAYHALVGTRIGELREARLSGIQPIEEFMSRRLTPAVATCATASQRLHDLSFRVAQASSLLSTRVDIARERQTQGLLASMDRRAKLQLRLQQTVEGLSVAAIVYYVAGLIGYLAKAAKAGGFPLQPDLLVGLAIPVVAFIVVFALRRARRKLHHHDA